MLDLFHGFQQKSSRKNLVVCECGCGAFQAEYQLPGPDGLIYALHVSKPCTDCSTPLGLMIYKFNPKEAGEWGVVQLPVLEPNSGGIGVSFLDPACLTQAILRVDVHDPTEVANAVIDATMKTRNKARAQGTW